MASVTGPISSLPGQTFAPGSQDVCDTHLDRKATHRVQGETDSYGSEMHDMCDECYAEYKDEKAKLGGGVFMGHCDCSPTVEQPMFAWRDYDEGMAGPVHYNCKACKTRIVTQMNEAAAEELEAYGCFDFGEDCYDSPDDFGDLDDEPPLAPSVFGFRFAHTHNLLSDRTGLTLQFSLRDAENFLRRSKGRVRGRRVILVPFS